MAFPNWLHPWFSSDAMTALALLVSVVALSASVGSCVVSQEALSETRKQFRQERQLVLKGEFKDTDDAVCSTIKAVPIAEGFQFQRGEARLPRQIYDRPVVIDPDGSFAFEGDACAAVNKFSNGRMRPKPGFISVSNGDIPILVKSFYAAKGEAYDDISLYLLHGTFSVSGDPGSWPTIRFSGLTFIRRLPADQPMPRQILDEMVAAKSGTFPSKTP